MATHSSTLAWRISWTEKPNGLQSMGSQSVRHDGGTNTLSLHGKENRAFEQWSLLKRAMRALHLLGPQKASALILCCLRTGNKPGLDPRRIKVNSWQSSSVTPRSPG